jgi:hypothetical protein
MSELSLFVCGRVGLRRGEVELVMWGGAGMVVLDGGLGLRRVGGGLLGPYGIAHHPLPDDAQTPTLTGSGSSQKGDSGQVYRWGCITEMNSGHSMWR